MSFRGRATNSIYFCPLKLPGLRVTLPRCRISRARNAGIFCREEESRCVGKNPPVCGILAEARISIGFLHYSSTSSRSITRERLFSMRLPPISPPFFTFYPPFILLSSPFFHARAAPRVFHRADGLRSLPFAEHRPVSRAARKISWLAPFFYHRSARTSTPSVYSSA